MSRLATGFPLIARSDWNRLLREHQDVLVVGGGIHGAGVARDAALRGLRVALIERDDWASGTSSRSSKLLHGGLRYLGQGAIGLVRESLRERELHLRLAPHLVHRVQFRVPPTPPGTTPRWRVRAGIALYDLLVGRLRHSGCFKDEPTFEDAIFQDARFCLEVVMDARHHGALAMSYVEWLEWVRHGDRVVGARVRDRFTGEEGLVSAGAFVNATGPWADLLLSTSRRTEPLLRLTRGTHVILDRREDDDARLFFAPREGRVLFLLPFDGNTSLLSTTDLDEPSPTKDPIPQAEEVRYLKEAFQSQFPEWSHWRPVGLQCGLRPLIAGDGAPSSLSREERIVSDAGDSLVTILGGKYTTYRKVAEQVVDRLILSQGRDPGSHPTRTTGFQEVERPADDHSRIRHAFAEEDAVRLEDVFLRRTSLGHVGRVGDDILAQAAKLWRLRWGKGEAETDAEIQAFLELQDRRLGPLREWTT